MQTEREYLSQVCPGLIDALAYYRQGLAEELRVWLQDVVDTVLWVHHQEPDSHCSCPFHDYPMPVIAAAAVQVSRQVLIDAGIAGNSPNTLVRSTSVEQGTHLVLAHPTARHTLEQESTEYANWQQRLAS